MVISWSRLSAFRVAPNGAKSVDDNSSAADPALCAKGLALPPDFVPVSCARSAHGRVVVASADGRLKEFNNEGATVAVDSYQLPDGIASVRLAGDRLVVMTKSGARSEWPFFDSLHDLIAYANARLWCAYRPFIAPILKGRKGSRAVGRRAKSDRLR